MTPRLETLDFTFLFEKVLSLCKETVLLAREVVLMISTDRYLV